MDKKGLDQILSGCLNNDRRSQGVLYERFYSYALSVALPYCADEEEAREVVNDAFFKAFSGIKRYDPAFSFATWLRTIVVRTAINLYHSRRDELARYEQVDLVHIPVEDELFSQLEANDLLRLVQDLPPAYRLTLNLYALEGYSHPEIAEMLGISVGTSKSNLSKARARLKRMLSDYLPKKYG